MPKGKNVSLYIYKNMALLLSCSMDGLQFASVVFYMSY